MSEQQKCIEEIEKFISAGKVNLPVFNPNALRVQQELIKTDPNMQVVEKLIVRDQALAGEVLKIANSPYYRGLVEVKTVKMAVVRLGMREIGRVVLLAASKTQFRIRDKELSQLMQKLWQHSAATGIAAHWLAQHTKEDGLGGHAFFAGLLHDIGKLFLVTAIEQAKIKLKIRLSINELLQVIDQLHTREGHSLMKRWNMPDEYADIVLHHHDDTIDSKNILMQVIRLADKVCWKLGIGLKREENLDLRTTQEAGMLGFEQLDFIELEQMLGKTKVLVS